MIVDGAYTENLFVDFISNCIDKGINFTRKTLLMDNVCFQKFTVVKNFATEKKVKSDFTPPYSIELNPIEETISSLNSKLFDKRPRATTVATLKKHIKDFIRDFDAKNTTMPFYEHMREWLGKAFTGIFC